MTTPNTPIEDKLEQILYNYGLQMGGGEDLPGATSFDETKVALLAWRDNAVEKAVRELSNRTAIQAGEMLARLTTPTKEREEESDE